MKDRQDENCRGGGDIHSDLFERIISLDNLFAAWKEFRRGKTGKRDVQAFEWKLEDSIFALHEDLKRGTYCHGTYESFYVCDPKRRHIHKPSVRDRLLHHAVVRVIEPSFDGRFIFDVWSCRKGKGTHRAVARFQKLAWSISRNDTRAVWVLKLDIQKFFESVDQNILLGILTKTITDDRVMGLLTDVIRRFPSGIPLGNLTSQLFANIYLNELDQFVKHELRAQFYVRYCDDFVLLHENRDALSAMLPRIRDFLAGHLALALHPQKITLTLYHRGVDFLGFVCFPHFRLLRTKTKLRMLRRVSTKNVILYAGLVRQARANGLRRALEFDFFPFEI